MNHINNILYCSSLCSEQFLEYIFITSKIKPLLSIQKFHRLLVEGINSNNCSVTSITSIPVTKNSSNKIFWRRKKEFINGIKYVYLPIINVLFLKQLCVLIFTFIKTFNWCTRVNKQESVIICDILNVSVSLSSLIVAKILNFKSCAIVTDLPQFMIELNRNNKTSFVIKLARIISSQIVMSYDCYIFLTEQMNKRINKHKKPYIIMEGLVDVNMAKINNTLENKSVNTILMYAGGINEKYGIRNLINAFIRLNRKDLRLHIYGNGDMENEMYSYMTKDSRIHFFGVVPNQVVVKKQIEATLLINPRPSNQEFTKYSFPSKNLEYMVSGTPIVTTLLPGMPEEYYNFVYIFNTETVEGMQETLESILSKSRIELHNFGCKSKQFVINNKNNHIQAYRLNQFFQNS